MSNSRKNFTQADLIQALAGETLWAMSPGWMETLQSWATMENFNPQQIVTEAGERFGTGMTRTSVREGVGIMQIRGPLFAHENVMTWLFGFDTYESIGKDFSNLMNESRVKGIVANFHSPGGQATGVDDLASMIYEARGLKPQGIVARAGGDMSSASYWLGSSFEEIHISSTGTVGSIGTVASFKTQDKNLITVVSDQSPKKRPDMNTPEGQAEIKAVLNDMSDVFISAVSRNRGVSPETVLSDFGQGGVKVGQKAVGSGMADKVTTFETTFKTINQTDRQETTEMSNENTTPVAEAPKPEATKPEETTPVAEAPKPEAQDQTQDILAQERSRVAGIMSAFAGTSFSEESSSFIAEGKSVAEAQGYVLEKIKSEKPTQASPAVSPSQLANEGQMANQASQPKMTQSSEDQTKMVMSSITAGANQYRAKNFGQSFQPKTNK